MIRNIVYIVGTLEGNIEFPDESNSRKQFARARCCRQLMVPRVLISLIHSRITKTPSCAVWCSSSRLHNPPHLVRSPICGFYVMEGSVRVRREAGDISEI